jgi:hypothetical protein
VEGNSIARIAEASEKPSIAAWQAIVIAAFAVNTDSAGTSNYHPTPRRHAAAPQGQQLLPERPARHPARPRQGRGSVRGNNLRGQSPNRPLVEISSLLGCRFDQNDAELTGKTG